MFDAVILAGGSGSRMGIDTPKSLLVYNGLSFIEHSIRTITSAKTKPNILLIIRDSKIANEIQSGLQHNCIINYYYNTPNLGIGGSLALNSKQLANPVIIMCSDLFIKVDLLPYIKRHNKRKVLFTMLLRKSEFTNEGIVKEFDGDIITEFEEHSVAKGCANSGIYICNPNVFEDYLGIDLATDIIPKLVKAGKLRGDMLGNNEYAIGANTVEEFKMLSGRYKNDNS